VFGLAICLLTGIPKTWFYSLVKDQISNTKAGEGYKERVFLEGSEKRDQNSLDRPVVTGGLKGLLESLSRFVTVGGDFAG
jgi:hypothetical protein